MSRFEYIITEELSVASMQADETKGSHLKRSVADAAWASFLGKLRCKAEEAGTKFEMTPTRQLRPTRRCSNCGAAKAHADMPLSQRTYACAICGFTLERDRNGCRNMMRWSFEGPWWGKKAETRPGTAPETPPEEALAQGE